MSNVPIHLQPVFAERGMRNGDRQGGGPKSEVGSRRSVSEELFAKGLCLPSGTAMTDEDIKRVADVVRKR